MKRVKRSLMSLLLIASLFFSSIAYGAIARADAGQDAGNGDNAGVTALYEENFDTATIEALQTDGWIFTLRPNGTPYYEMKEGALRGIYGDAYYGKEEAYNWTDYTYESKMTIANKYNLKTPQYGKYFYSKSEYSCKEVETFRYYECAIAKFREILEGGAVA